MTNRFVAPFGWETLACSSRAYHIYYKTKKIIIIINITVSAVAPPEKHAILPTVRKLFRRKGRQKQ